MYCIITVIVFFVTNCALNGLSVINHKSFFLFLMKFNVDFTSYLKFYI